ncbi:uncharacterized protein LOC128209549 [Mya arenaria]|uniref:uncharacterized protein LOC128209549 n=1 Tax=Mya arenaria TaxID=6604 RepID=UPI0022E1FB5C|nr:uncharacterized protein LOC128209549 [Mya arenaria]XP_052769583.1 uncharacterized protein LOC128209549 [Mya arenaria]
MNRKRSNNRRSSILKIDMNADDDTRLLLGKNRRASKRVSFAECYQVKEFPKDSPRRWRTDDEENDDPNCGDAGRSGSKNSEITGLDKLLTGAIQTPYQDVAECPIPEMTSQSFNIMDANRTVFDAVDMDMTSADGGDIVMDFQASPSKEIEYNASSFLSSLKGKPSDMLKSLQIYSPNRDQHRPNENTEPDPTFLTFPSRSVTRDKENVVPVAGMEGEGAVNWRAMLDRVFSSSHAAYSQQQDTEDEPMEETRCYSDMFLETNQPPTHTSQSVIQPSKENTPPGSDEVTKYFVDGVATTFGMEETRCVGGIVSGGPGIAPTGPGTQDRDGDDKTQCIPVPMEETKALGDILIRTVDKHVAMEKTCRDLNSPASQSMEVVETDADTMNYTVMVDVPMEETKAVGGIMNTTVGQSIHKDDTSAKIVNQTINHTVAMEETRALGGILNKTKTQDCSNADTRSVLPHVNKTVNQTLPMEETRTVGEILNKTATQTVSEVHTNTLNKLNQTINQTVPMDETKSLGGILNKTATQTGMKIGTFTAGLNKTTNEILPMDETRSLGGVLNKTNNPTVSSQKSTTFTAGANITIMQPSSMDETLAGGKIINESINGFNSNELKLNHSSLQTVAMEETNVVGGIVKHSVIQISETISPEKDQNMCMNTEATVYMQETRPLGGIIQVEHADSNKDKVKPSETFVAQSPNDNVHPCIEKDPLQEKTQTLRRRLSQIMSQNVDETKTYNMTVPMEMTQVTGGILQSGIQTLTTELSTWKVGDIVKSPNQTVTVEEIRVVGKENTSWPVGGILNKHVNQTESMEEMSPERELVNRTLHQTVSMEETRAVGGILDKYSKQPSPMETDSFNRSNNKTVPMKETKCVGTNLQTDISVTSPFEKTQREDSTENERAEVTCISGDTGQECDDDSSEVTFKISHKRSLDEMRSDASDQSEGKTQDLTQSQTKLLKLKGSLLAMKKVTASKIKVGEIKTPSKLSPAMYGGVSSARKGQSAVQPDMSVRSPAHKLARLYGSWDPGVERPDPTDALLQGFTDGETGFLNDFERDNLTGIDGESMPEGLVDDGVMSETQDTVFARSDTYSTDTRSHATSSDSSNLSVITNKSYISSFIVPDGPLSVESFFELTKVKTCDPVKMTRRSSIFTPKVDEDDLTELLYSLIALSPVHAGKRENMTALQQGTHRLECEIGLLEQDLEELQPVIFQECVAASREEMTTIKASLLELLKTCKMRARVEVKKASQDMHRSFLNHVQSTSIPSAKKVMSELEGDLKSVDQLLTSLDAELEEMDLMERKMVDLDFEQQRLQKNVEEERERELGLERKVAEAEIAANQHASKEDRSMAQHISQLQDTVKAHLKCSQWDLEELTETGAVFTFCDSQLYLHVGYKPGPQHHIIDTLTLSSTSTQERGYFEDEVFHNFALSGVNTDSLTATFPSEAQLPELLHEISTTISEIQRFCADVEAVNLNHKLLFQNQALSVEMWPEDFSSPDFVILTLQFDPARPLSTLVKPQVSVKFGDIVAGDIEQQLCGVTPGHRYLSRLLQAVTFSPTHR